MRPIIITFVSVVVLFYTSAFGQSAEQNTNEGKHFIGGSVFMLANFAPNPPSFYQLNYGIWLSPQDVISLETKTWIYRKPLGIPYGPSFDSPTEEYPGYVRGFGLGVTYQRFVWNAMYLGADATCLLQKYVDEQQKKTQNGFQLFMSFRIGYHLPLFEHRLFIEPSLAVTHWPVNTNVPQSFKTLDDRWPTYFLFEPGLHFGIYL